MLRFFERTCTNFVRFLLCALGIIALIFLLQYVIITSPCESQEKRSGGVEEKRVFASSNILVLGWAYTHSVAPNKLYDNWFHLKLPLRKNFDVCYDQGYLDKERYPCTYTSDLDRIKEAHAVLFRGRRLGTMPQSLSKTRASIPNQKWIFFEHEPPNKVWQAVNLTKYNNLFNITATYSLDSDIPKVTQIRNCVRNDYKLQELQGTNFAGKKTQKAPVAWMVSVCETQSKREDYVKELQKYIKVDIYGECGPLKCGSARTWMKDQCTENLLHSNGSYKFYLSFENSLCDDYISEKVWKVMKYDVVPIVMGATDYSNMLPKDSYIDVRDFKSPQHLAEYLHHLDQHDDLYNQYIRNKKSLICSDLDPNRTPWECSMCRYLHDHRIRPKVVHNLDIFWGSNRCMKPKYLFDRNNPGDFGS